MDSQEISNKTLKVEIPSTESETKQRSCLCSPTTHAGSFRCRLHRSPTLHRSTSMDSAPFKRSHYSEAKARVNTAKTQ
ncbi:hypothetical protein NMG60_11009104 [Bertholletia excelsa]